MKTNVKIVALLLMLTVLFTACGKKEEPGKMQSLLEENEALSQGKNGELSGKFYYTEDDITLEFDGVNSFSMESADAIWSGTYAWDGSSLRLYDESGSEMTGTVDENGEIRLTEYNAAFRPESAAAQILGQWGFYGEEFYMTVYKNNTAEIKREGEVYTFDCIPDGDYYELYDGDELVDRFYINTHDEIIWDSMPDRKMLAASRYPECVSEVYDLEANWTPEDQTVILENGSRWENDDALGLIPAAWQVQILSDEVSEEGIRKLVVTVISGLPVDTTPDMPNTHYYRWCNLYDYDTGTALANDVEIEDLETVEFEHPGGHVVLKFRNSRESPKESVTKEGGFVHTLIYDMVIEMPAWYHGLMLGALTLTEVRVDTEYPKGMNIAESELYPQLQSGLRMHLN